MVYYLLQSLYTTIDKIYIYFLAYDTLNHANKIISVNYALFNIKKSVCQVKIETIEFHDPVSLKIINITRSILEIIGYIY